MESRVETSRVAQLPWESLGSLPSDIAQRNHPVLQSPQQRLIGLEPVLVSRLYQEAKMQIGDLVKSKNRFGIIIEVPFSDDYWGDTAVVQWMDGFREEIEAGLFEVIA